MIRLVQQKTLSVNTWEFHSLSSTLDGEHFFGAPQSKINCRNTLAGVKVIARSNWSSEIVGSSHHRKKGILLSTWSARWRCERFLLGARAAVAFNVKTGQDYSPAAHLFSATARWGVPLAVAFIKYLFFMIESWLLLFTGSWTSLI